METLMTIHRGIEVICSSIRDERVCKILCMRKFVKWQCEKMRNFMEIGTRDPRLSFIPLRYKVTQSFARTVSPFPNLL